jgi:flagellar basal-body rod modification protein FlgD
MVDPATATNPNAVVNTVNPAGGSGSGNNTSNAQLTGAIQQDMGKEDFLNLLVTQLRYQDPLSPEDPKEFVAQLAQFSSLEQQINANQNLQDMGKHFQSLKASQNMAQGVALLGKTVKGSGNQITVAGGKALEASINLPLDAKEAVVAIFDASGRQVRTLDLGSLAAGSRTLSWDGKDSQGKTVPDGIYSYQVAALDESGKPMEVANFFTGKVQEVYQDAHGVWVKVNGRQVLIDNIVSVAQGS